MMSIKSCLTRITQPIAIFAVHRDPTSIIFFKKGKKNLDIVLNINNIVDNRKYNISKLEIVGLEGAIQFRSIAK